MRREFRYGFKIGELNGVKENHQEKMGHHIVDQVIVLFNLLLLLLKIIVISKINTVYNGIIDGSIGASWYASQIPQVSEQMAVTAAANVPMYHAMVQPTSDMNQSPTAVGASHIYLPTTNNPNELFGNYKH